MLMHNPPHPGEILKELCLEPLGISVTKAAKALGVSRKMLSSIVNGKAGISREIALLFAIFGAGLAASLAPAIRVYRMTLADGLSVRL